MSKSWIYFVNSTASAHTKCELDGVDENLSSHLDWLSDLENLEHRPLKNRPTTASHIEDQLCLNLVAKANNWLPPPHISQPDFEEDDQSNIEQDATFMENIKVPSKEVLNTTDKDAISNGNIIQDPTQLADFIKDFFPDYQLEDIMSSPMKSQQNDVGLPSPPFSKPPSPIPPATRTITPSEECPCETKSSQNLLSNDDPFREYFEEKLSVSQWSFLNASRPPPPSYSKDLPAKHKLLQQADPSTVVTKKDSHFRNGLDSKTSSKTTYQVVNGSKTLPKKQTVEQVHETMKSSLPHARLATLAKYDIDVVTTPTPLSSRLLQMAEKNDLKHGKPAMSLSKAPSASEKRTSRNISMERINRLAQPKRPVDKSMQDAKTASMHRMPSKSPSKLSVAQKNATGAKHFGVTQVRQKRSQPMSLTAAAIALDNTTGGIDSTKRTVPASTSVLQRELIPKELDWALPQNLQAALEDQSKVNPDDIFGKIASIEIDDIFGSKSNKLQAPSPSRPLRLRVNSCMTRVTHQEETAYRIAMGYAVC